MPLVPEIVGPWWSIAGIPDLGPYNLDGQQPLDFTIWQATDGTWQMAACCRQTGCGGKGRLFHRWESASLLDEDWVPMGVFMVADPNVGETVGGLQAPHVFRHGDEFFLFYGDWVNICAARSSDGKRFERMLGADRRSRLFPLGEATSMRDPYTMEFGGRFYLYYTGITGDTGSIFCRTSDDLRSWGPTVVVSRGGSAGCGTSDAECPFVTYLEGDGVFHLFRTHTRNGGPGYATSLYRSADPLDFGVDSDVCKLATLPLEAVRLVESDGQTYIAALKPDLTGMMMARMAWKRG
jgi:hypothetical protein